MQFGDLGNLFQNIQKAQQELSKAQEELATKQVEGSAGGGKVTATVNGRMELVKVTIDPEVIDSDPDEVALLEDMIVAAVNQALTKSRELAQTELGKLTGGMDLENLWKMFQR